MRYASIYGMILALVNGHALQCQEMSSSPKNPMIPKEPDVDDVEVNRRPGVRGGAASHMQRDRWRFHPALHTFPDAQRCFEMLWRIL